MNKTLSTNGSRIRNRSVPPPPNFDPTGLPDDFLLTPKELAGWLRLSVSTLEDWRCKHPHRGPTWVLVAGLPRYRIGDVRKWLFSDTPFKNTRQASEPISESSSGKKAIN
jgi:hypothetical protein